MIVDPKQLQKIAYFMDHEVENLGLVSEYHAFMNDRLVFRVYVQIEDEQRVTDTGCVSCFPVWVADAHGKNALRVTEGHAVRKTDEVTGKERISSDSVKRLISALLPWILVELYVPKN